MNRADLLSLIEAAEAAIAAYDTERARLIAERKAAPEAEQTSAHIAKYARQIVAIGKAPIVARNKVLDAAAAMSHDCGDLEARVDALAIWSTP